MPEPRAQSPAAPVASSAPVASVAPVALALLVAGCFFMENLDSTIVTTAAPRIGADLHVPAASVGLIVTGYMLALAVFIPAGGWLLTILRARTLFSVAIAVFMVGSLGCGLSSDLAMITALRVLQGVGGALMVPVGRQLVLRDAPQSEVIRMVAYITWPGLLAPVIAPLAGGLIVDHASWRWLFFINLPLGAIALACALRLVPDTIDTPRRGFDVVGFVLVGVGLGGLTWAAHLIADQAATTAVVLITIAVSVLVCALAVRHLLSSPAPLIQLSVLVSDRIFRLSQFGMSSFAAIVASVPFLIPLELETALHWSPVAAGALVMFVFVGNIGIKPATTPLLRRYGFRPMMLLGTSALIVTVAPWGLAAAHIPVVPLALIAMLSGAARSLTLTCLNTVMFSTISKQQRRTATTLAATNQQLSTGLGVAIATIALRAGVALSGGPGAGAFAYAFLLICLVGMWAFVAALALPRDAGEALRG